MLYLFDTLFQLFAGHGNIPAAASADYTHIAADAQNGVMLFTAGMGLFHFKHIPDADFGYDRHMLPPAIFTADLFAPITILFYLTVYHIQPAM